MSDPDALSLLDSVATPLLIVHEDRLRYGNAAARRIFSPLPERLSDLLDVPAALATTMRTVSDHKGNWFELSASEIIHQDAPALLITLIPRSSPEILFAPEILEPIFEEQPMLIYIFDLELRRSLYVNSSVIELLGYSPEEIRELGSGAWDVLLHPEDRARVSELLGQPHDPGVHTWSYRMRHKDGSWRWFQSRNRILPREGVFPRRSVGVTLDITRLKDLEEALSERVRFAEQVIHASPDLIYLSEEGSGRLNFISERITAITGYTAEEYRQILSDQWQQIFHPDDWPAIVENGRHLSVLPDDKVAEVQFRLKHKDGSWRWMLNRAVVFQRDGQGKPLQHLGVARDISQLKALEAALDERARFAERLLHSSPAALLLTDLAPVRTVFASEQLKTLLGISGAEFLRDYADDWTPVIHPDDRPRVINTLEQYFSLADGEVIENEFRARHTDGTWRWVAIHATIFQRDSTGTPIQVITTLTDVTIRRELEAALEERIHFSEQILSAAPDMIFIVDLERGCATFANEQFSLLGYRAEEIVSIRREQWAQYVHPDDLEPITQRLPTLSMLADHEVGQGEYRLRHADGSWRWIAGRAIIFERDDSGVPTHVLGVLRDVTNKKAMEDALREREAMYRLMMEEAQEAVFLINERGKTILANRRAMQMCGSTLDDVLHHDIREFVHSEDLYLLESALSSIYENRPVLVEFRLMHRRRAEAVFVELSGKRLPDGRVQLVLRDITERKEIERSRLEQERLQAALDAEREIGAFKNRLMHVISHEFRTPLTMINSAAELLERYSERQTPEQRQARYTQIYAQIAYLIEMLEDIGLVLHGASPSATHKISHFDLHAVCTTQLEQIRYTSGKGHALSLVTDSEPLLVLGEERLVRRMVSNLLSNAVKYSPIGHPITLTLTTQGRDAIVEVSDRGIGIAQEDLQHLTEPFFRGINVGEIKGLGLGLSIVQDCVNTHRGTLKVHSTPSGSTFTVTLPIRDL